MAEPWRRAFRAGEAELETRCSPGFRTHRRRGEERSDGGCPGRRPGALMRVGGSLLPSPRRDGLCASAGLGAAICRHLSRSWPRLLRVERSMRRLADARVRARRTLHPRDGRRDQSGSTVLERAAASRLPNGRARQLENRRRARQTSAAGDRWRRARSRQQCVAEQTGGWSVQPSKSSVRETRATQQPARTSSVRSTRSLRCKRRVAARASVDDIACSIESVAPNVKHSRRRPGQILGPAAWFTQTAPLEGSEDLAAGRP